MQTQYILLILGVGVIAVTAEEGSNTKQNNIVKLSGTFPKPGHPRNITIPDRTGPVIRLMYTLAWKVDAITKNAYAVFTFAEADIKTRSKVERKFLEKYVGSIQAHEKSKESQEVEEAKKGGKAEDAEKIEFCVQDEQERFQKGLTSDLNQAILCWEHMLKTANDRADHARRTFNNVSLYRSTYTDDTRKKWYHCAIPTVHQGCIRRNLNEILDTIDRNNAIAEKTTEMSRQASKKYAEDVKICHVVTRRDIKERKEEHAENIKKCIKNPEYENSLE